MTEYDGHKSDENFHSASSSPSSKNESPSETVKESIISAIFEIKDERKLRQALSSASKLNLEFLEFEKASALLEDTCADIDFMLFKKQELYKNEIIARLNISDFLEFTCRKKLTPREYTILHLHYLEYHSWNSISSILNIDRRYSLQIHKNAIKKLLG